MEPTTQCAAPGCSHTVLVTKPHCEQHYTQFSRSHKLYKKEQRKIAKYVDNPRLVLALEPTELIRVAGTALTVSQKRREHSLKGFKEELQDEGHNKMTNSLLSLSLQASQQLTLLFSLPPVNDIPTPITNEEDDTPPPIDPWQLVISLHRERDKLVKVEQQRRKEQVEGNKLLDKLVREKLRWRQRAILSLILFMKDCNKIMIEKYDPPPFIVLPDGRIQDTLTISSREELTTQAPRTYCAMTRKTDNILDRCPTFPDLETFYQQGFDIASFLDNMGKREKETMVVDHLRRKCPPRSFISISFTDNHCLKFIVCVEQGKNSKIAGEVLIELSHAVRCGKNVFVVGVCYLKYIR